jgi:hypothetical protein
LAEEDGLDAVAEDEEDEEAGVVVDGVVVDGVLVDDLDPVEAVDPADVADVAEVAEALALRLDAWAVAPR